MEACKIKQFVQTGKAFGSFFQSKLTIIIFLLAASLLTAGCSDVSPSTLDPKGPGAEEIALIWWVMFGLSAAVFGLVMVLLVIALFRSRSKQTDPNVNEQKLDRWFLIAGGIVMPLIVLGIVYYYAIWGMAVMAAPDPDENVVIEVIGWQWWWEVRYPNQKFTTANEIHIPVNERVKLQVTAYDVIHSFWVPELHGKIDMIPGQTNTFWIEANEPGVYYGECAEFCGIQHAKMAFLVVAEPAEEFNTWLEEQQQPAAEPSSELAQRGFELFFSEPLNCAECHAIRGTEAEGELGPDLTHLGSRRTLAAGIMPNNRGHLAGWIINPQNIKPGNLMPSTDLTGPELQELLAYLETLK